MKKIVYLLIVAGFLSVSCASDDSATNAASGTSAYFPTTKGNYWVYKTKNSTTTGRDSLYTANDTVISNTDYKKLKTKNAPTGFFAGTLNNNAVRNIGSKLILTGNTSLSFSKDVPIAIAVTDFIFFDADVSPGLTIGYTAGTVKQDIDNGYTIDINYTLSATSGEALSSYTVPNGKTYSNVKTANIKLNVSIIVFVDVLGTKIPFSVMKAQDVLVSTQYYSKNIGAVYVATDINYTLNDLSSLKVTLPVASSGSEHQDEILDTYQVNAQ